MNDETIHQFSPGVQILLERVKTNPEDFLERGKFRSLTDDVYTTVHMSMDKFQVGCNSPLRMLKPAEIHALHDALVEMERPSFDAWVLKQLLDAPKEEEFPGIDAFRNARLAQNVYGTNAFQELSLQGLFTKQEEQIREDAKKLNLLHVLKDKFKKL